MPEQDLDICVHEDDGSYWATVDEFPGVFASGHTFDELGESREEGISLVLAASGEQPPPVRLHLERAVSVSAPLLLA